MVGSVWAAVPVEAEAVQTLLAWLVNRVESGAGILLLSAIWSATAPSVPLNYCLDTSQPLLFLPRGPGSVGSVSSSSSDITHAEMSDRHNLEHGDPNGTRVST